MKSVGRYLRAVLGNGKTYLTGGAPIALLVIADHVLHVPVPRWFEILVGVLALLAAPFAAWKQEHEARASAEDRVRKLEQATEQDWLAPDTSAEEFWALAATGRYTLRRQFHESRRGGTANSFWIGQTPIDYYDAQWFYGLIDSVVKRGLMRTDKEIYRLTPEGERALSAGKKKGRLPVQPGELIGALSGKPESFPLS